MIAFLYSCPINGVCDSVDLDVNTLVQAFSHLIGIGLAYGLLERMGSMILRNF